MPTFLYIVLLEHANLNCYISWKINFYHNKISRIFLTNLASCSIFICEIKLNRIAYLISSISIVLICVGGWVGCVRYVCAWFICRYAGFALCGCTCICMSMCTWKPEVMLKIILYQLLQFSHWSRVFQWNPDLADMANFAAQLPWDPLSVFPEAGITGGLTYSTRINKSFWGSEYQFSSLYNKNFICWTISPTLYQYF